MGRLDQDSRCPACGARMTRVLSPTGDKLGTFECIKCDPRDPLKSDKAAGWIQGELRPPQ